MCLPSKYLCTFNVKQKSIYFKSFSKRFTENYLSKETKKKFRNKNNHTTTHQIKIEYRKNKVKFK